MEYLIYDTEAEAVARADENGQRLKFSHWIEGKGTRWIEEPQVTADGSWALRVDSMYILTDDEESAKVADVTFPTEEE